MSGKQPAFLLWDCTGCPAKNIDFIQSLTKVAKAHFTKIIIFARDQSSIPPSVNDFTLVYPNVLVTRYGDAAFYDTIVDVVSFTAQAANNFTFALISNEFSMWITLFQRIEPKRLLFVSTEDPQTCLDFSFLPSTTQIQIYRWPDLKEVEGNAGASEIIDQEIPENHVDNEYVAFEEEEEPLSVEESVNEEPSAEDDLFQQQSPPARAIQPLSNLEKHQIDLRSPVANSSHLSESGEGNLTPKRMQSDQIITVPTKFQPLIEAMKSIGKAMISLSDLESQLKVYCTKYNVPQQNINTLITKATDAGLVIFDKSINYVRFRNRAMASAKIEYN